MPDDEQIDPDDAATQVTADVRERTSVVATVRAAVSTLQPGMRRRWYLLVLLAIVDAVLEAFGAAAIYLLVRVVTDPKAAHDIVGISTFRDWLSGVSDSTFVVILGALIAGFYVGKNVLLLFEAYAQARLANDAAATTAGRLLRGYFAAPWSFHFIRASAELIRNTTETVDTVYRLVLLSGTALVSDTLVVAGILAVLLASAPLVTLLAAATLGGLLVATFRVTDHRFRRWGGERQELAARNLRTLQESLGAMKEIKLLGRERFFLGEFDRDRQRLSGVFWRSATALQFPRLAMETVFVLVMVLIVSVVTLQDAAQDRAVALLGLYAYAGFRLLPSVNRIVNGAANVRLGVAAIKILRADLASTAAFPPEPVDAAPLPFERQITVEGVSFRYPGTEAVVLSDIDLVVERGEMIGLMGATGSGKSTLADLLMGVLEPTDGRVAVDGVDVRSDLRGWQRNIGYVSQSTFLHAGSLRRNIALGVADAEIDEERIREAVRLSLLDDVVAVLPGGLDGSIGERGVRLSGGQQQRIAIARALYHDPSVLVFDEATSSLDNRTAGEVTRAIIGLAGSRTLFVIAHRVESVQACASVIFLEGGRVADLGTFDELVASNAAFRRTISHLEGAERPLES